MTRFESRILFCVRKIVFIFILFIFPLSHANLAVAQGPVVATAVATSAIGENCEKAMSVFPGKQGNSFIKQACQKVVVKEGCKSVKGADIFHYDKSAAEGTKQKHSSRILVISMIHGDEYPAGTVTRAWMSRLETIDSRNDWRIIPVANPDGVVAKTRFNANKIDLNRNFPSKDWTVNALKYWESKTKKDPRRFPGAEAASEPETKCLIAHIDEYKPHLIISVHTPLGVLDLDGPPVPNPGFKPLPWVNLRDFPGSLGRYMWADKKTPVLTIELKGLTGLSKLEEFDRLQDATGTVAMQAQKLLTDADKGTKNQ
jgi:protein MpaA